MNLNTYISNINSRYKLGNATEHTFRGDLQQLFEALLPGIKATNEPKRQACGAPDYILTKKDIPIAFVEAKDVGADLNSKAYKEQFDRYRSSLNNLIITDYVTFQFFKEGIKVDEISIAEIGAKGITAKTENFEKFELLLIEFCKKVGQTIKNPKKLAEMMAGKARLLADVIEKSLLSDSENSEDSTLKDQMIAFQEILIHDITPKAFADVYAQTIAYGMFAARLHDSTLDDFSRQEAAELIPKSNPFLRKLFGYIAGPDIDDRIKWIVDKLVEIFLACNVAEILANYGKETKTEDPIIHFYETFLSEYDPKLRKARGVWYTPAPVVSFIVRAVDEILKTEFDLPNGLADTSKTKIKVNMQGKMVEQEVHKVQILDPATGTGTFLAETIKHIHKNFEGQQGIWSNYVENHLIPRLNGFELLMASYAMAHLKLELLLTETGFKPSSNQRLRVYLTNSLEEHHQDTGTLFANWLSTEASEANRIKRDTPVMCVIGNPPYSGISSNNGEWISKLIEDYKYVDGVHFNERKHWLNDDYVKFIRYGQHFIEKNGSGVLAFINPHGFLDNPTFRGMRWHLLKTFDKIYTIDLHGNAKKKETAPDGSSDVNVFDIMQGVSINIFVKTGLKKATELGKVLHFDLYGKREIKYDFLSANLFKDVHFKEISYSAPFYFFVPKNENERLNYEKGFNPDELFKTFNTGIVTGIDRLSIFISKDDLNKTIEKILTSTDPFTEFNIKDTRRTNKEGRIIELKNAFAKGIIPINYRPFDIQYTLPFEKNEYWINSPRIDVMQHFLKGENIGIAIGRQGQATGSDKWDVVIVTNCIVDFNYYRRGGEVVFPLYLYPEKGTSQSLNLESNRTPI
jgi:predicted helicase